MLELRFLGGIEIARAGTPVVLPPSKKTRALLAFLAVSGKPHRRERICEMFWDLPDDPRGSLRWSLSKLRAVVDEADCPRIVADRDWVGFEAGGARIDVHEIKARYTAPLEQAPIDGLKSAAAAFNGDFLEGLDLTSCPTSTPGAWPSGNSCAICRGKSCRRCCIGWKRHPTRRSGTAGPWCGCGRSTIRRGRSSCGCW